MYVCICNAVTERDIEQAVMQGDNTYERVCRKLGVASCCGRCQDHAREVIANVSACKYHPINEVKVPFQIAAAT